MLIIPIFKKKNIGKNMKNHYLFYKYLEIRKTLYRQEQ